MDARHEKSRVVAIEFDIQEHVLEKAHPGPADQHSGQHISG